jgi:chromosome segregation ATPase
MKIDGYAYANKGEMDEIQEEVDEEVSSSKEELSQKSEKQELKSNKSKDEISEELGISGEKSENFEKEIVDLEEKIETLKEDNELLQRKINLVFEFRKKEGREEKNFYKESNINESTYADSLTSTAGLYNDLNTHKRKLDQDLQRYQQSIEEQEKRKQDVYEILMKYKEELLDNAETRKGTKIPRGEIENWLGREKQLEDTLRNLRIQSFTKSLEMNRLKKELKKMEDYFEGLHIIDFEQLKIENNTLTEKIEDRNEEIHKIKIKINDTVQTLAHLQEKSKFISSENEVKKTENENLKKQIIDMKKKLTMKKEENDKKALKQLNANKKIDQINSMPLKNYYRRTLQHIQELSVQIDQVSKQLMVYRQKRKGTKKDITDLLQRKEKMMREFRSLPKMENDL